MSRIGWRISWQMICGPRSIFRAANQKPQPSFTLLLAAEFFATCFCVVGIGDGKK